MISVAFDDVRSRLFLFACGVSLVNVAFGVLIENDCDIDLPSSSDPRKISFQKRLHQQYSRIFVTVRCFGRERRRGGSFSRFAVPGHLLGFAVGTAQEI
jgi:hypothetical protein